jgi:hypothetical protein
LILEQLGLGIRLLNFIPHFIWNFML